MIQKYGGNRKADTKVYFQVLDALKKNTSKCYM